MSEVIVTRILVYLCLALLFLVLFAGCSHKYVYSSSRYMQDVVDVCDGQVAEFTARDGSFKCKRGTKR